jgi:hypothetical protein
MSNAGPATFLTMKYRIGNCSDRAIRMMWQRRAIIAKCPSMLAIFSESPLATISVASSSE